MMQKTKASCCFVKEIGVDVELMMKKSKFSLTQKDVTSLKQDFSEEFYYYSPPA